MVDGGGEDEVTVVVADGQELVLVCLVGCDFIEEAEVGDGRFLSEIDGWAVGCVLLSPGLPKCGFWDVEHGGGDFTEGSIKAFLLGLDHAELGVGDFAVAYEKFADAFEHCCQVLWWEGFAW